MKLEKKSAAKLEISLL